MEALKKNLPDKLLHFDIFATKQKNQYFIFNLFLYQLTIFKFERIIYNMILILLMFRIFFRILLYANAQRKRDFFFFLQVLNFEWLTLAPNLNRTICRGCVFFTVCFFSFCVMLLPFFLIFLMPEIKYSNLEAMVSSFVETLLPSNNKGT